MIKIHIPGFSKPKSENRYGDAQVISDGTNHLVIDGYEGTGATKLISYLKSNKMYKPHLLITHWHYDHYNGIERIIDSSSFTPITLYCQDPSSIKHGQNGTRYANCVTSAINAGNRIIGKAKKKGIKIIYLKSGDVIRIGEILFKVYRNQPKKLLSSDTEAWAFLNDGSICTYFPDLYYWTSGDGCESIAEGVKAIGGKVKLFKIPHHGNNCSRSNSQFMKNQGADYCWYNDLEPNGVGTCGFTAYGARRCKQAGITVIDCIGDIDMVANNRKLQIVHNGKSYSFSIPYSGNLESDFYKDKSDAILAVGVIHGEYGSGNDRKNILGNRYNSVQKLVNHYLSENGHDDYIRACADFVLSGYAGSGESRKAYFGTLYEEVQNKVNWIIKTAKDVINNKYGVNEKRKQLLGDDYQVVQNEVNRLLKN